MAQARRTNVALLGLLPLALVTGALAYALGTPTMGTAVVVVHGIAGLGVAVVAPRKSHVVRRGWRRARPGRPTSAALAVLAVVTVLTGVAHSAGVRSLGIGVTALQVHVGAALGVGVLAAAHARVKPSRPRRTDLSRRALLGTGVLSAAAGAAWLGGEGAWRLLGTRGAGRRFTGSHEEGSDEPAAMPVTQWFTDGVPALDDAHRVVVAGRALQAAELDRGDEVVAVLDCTGGWYARQTWSGTRLDRALGPVDAGAASVLVRSVTGYTRRFPLSDAPRMWLATRCAGAPLSAGHGAPVRLVAPGRRGYQWVKWVAAVEVDALPPWAQAPFPLQ